MRAISPDMRKAAPIRQDQGRPHVLNIAEDERNTSIMTYPFVPQQRPVGSCTVPGCMADHCGEQIGQLSHWIDDQDVRTSTGPLFVDLNLSDGGLPQIVLHDVDGHERHLSAEEAFSYGAAIIAAAHAGQRRGGGAMTNSTYRHLRHGGAA